MLEDRAAERYRALNRLPPRVLAADDPLTFFRCVRALGRPSTVQLVLGGLLTILLFAVLLVGQPAARAPLPPALGIGVTVYMLAMVAWLEGFARVGVQVWLRLLPALNTDRP